MASVRKKDRYIYVGRNNTRLSKASSCVWEVNKHLKLSAYQDEQTSKIKDLLRQTTVYSCEYYVLIQLYRKDLEEWRRTILIKAVYDKYYTQKLNSQNV